MTLKLIILILMFIFLLFTLLGMVKPWYVLWWLDHQNRLKVLKYYGGLAILFLFLNLIFNAH